MAATVLIAAPAALAQTVAQQAAKDDLSDLRTKAERGDMGAAATLGAEIILQKQESRYEEARRWLEKSAAAGNADGMNGLASAYAFGIGGPEDEAKARQLWNRAAAAGSLGAKMTLMQAYSEGAGGYPKDPARAFKQALEIAQLPASGPTAVNIGFAQWRLAMMYREGFGVAKNLEEAYRWTARSADNGFVNGMLSKAVMLATGEGVKEDDAAARAIYQRAAERRVEGSEHALRGLGGMLIIGEGGPKDVPRGFAYLMVAHTMGDEMAQKLIEHHRSLLTPEVEAQAKVIGQAEVDKWPTSD